MTEPEKQLIANILGHIRIATEQLAAIKSQLQLAEEKLLALTSSRQV